MMSLLGHSLPEGDAVHVENCDRGLAFRELLCYYIEDDRLLYCSLSLHDKTA